MFGTGRALVPVYRAPTVIPGGIRLLVVGSPIHAFSTSRASTRQDAWRQAEVVMPAAGARTSRGRCVP